MRMYLCDCVLPKYKGLEQNPKMDHSTTESSNDVRAINTTEMENTLIQTDTNKQQQENSVKMSMQEKLTVIFFHWTGDFFYHKQVDWTTGVGSRGKLRV